MRCHLKSARNARPSPSLSALVERCKPAQSACVHALLRFCLVGFVAFGASCQNRARETNRGRENEAPLAAPAALLSLAPVAPLVATPFDAKRHCRTILQIARSEGLLAGERTELTATATAPTISPIDEDRVEEGIVIPEGFTACKLYSTTIISSSMHNVYACTTAPGTPTSTFSAISSAWRACLKAPAWKPAATFRDSTGVASVHAQVPDAYISSYVRPVRGLHTEAFCKLESSGDVITMSCGTTTNN